jgi:hypothetical protein
LNMTTLHSRFPNLKLKSFRLLSLIFISIFIIAVSACGGGGSSSSDTTSPTLATAPAISPANGTIGVNYDVLTSFSASEQLSSATIKMTCDGVEVLGTTKVVGAVATFAPQSPGFAASSKCVATVDATATKDLAGNSFSGTTALTSFAVKPLACNSAAASANPAFNGTTLIGACGNVFIDPAVAKNQYPVIVDSINAALQSVKTSYVMLLSAQPDVIVCSTTPCSTFFAGPNLRNLALPPGAFAGQYTAPRSTVVLVSATYVRNQFVLAHEFSHVELAARVKSNRVPAWFNEGLATYVGGEPVCAGVSGNGVTSLLTLDLESAWTSYTNSAATFDKTYCQARAEVAAWIAQKGPSAVTQLLTSVGNGQSFSSQYGVLINP